MPSASFLRLVSGLCLLAAWSLFAGKPVVAASPVMRVLILNSYHDSLVLDALSALPKGSMVHHRPLPFYVRYRQVLWGAAISLAEAIIIVLLVGILINRRRILSALRKSEQRFKELADLLPLAVFEMDEHGRLSFLNQQGFRMFGYHPDDLDRDLRIEMLLPEEVRRLPARLQQDPGSGISGDEYLARHRDGTEFPIALYSSPITQGDRVVGVRGIIVDETERTLVEEALRDSEEHFRTLFEAGGDAIFLISDIHCIRCNRKALEMFRATKEQILRESPWQFSPPRQPDGQASEEKAAVMVAAALAGQPQVFEWQHRRFDGTLFFTEVNLTRIDVQGRAFLQAMVRDISERKEAEAVRRESEETTRMLLNAMPDTAVLLRVDGTILALNAPAAHMTGQPARTLVGENLFTLLSSDILTEKRRRLIAEVIHSGTPVRFEDERDGIYMANSLYPLFSAQGNVDRLAIFSRDITARKRAELALRESEMRYRILVDTSPDAITVADLQRRIMATNPSAAAMWGFACPEEAIGLDAFALISPEEGDRAIANLEMTFREGITRNTEYRFLRKDGTTFIGELSASLVRDVHGEPQAFVAVTRDVTDRKQAEEALAAETERLAVTLRSIGDGVITTDTDGRITLLNRVAEELTGWSQGQAIGRPLDEVFHIIHEHTHERCPNPVERVLATGGTIELANHTVLLARDSTERIIADSGAPIRDRHSRVIGVVLVFRDVTAEIRLHTDIQRAAKLESLGVLAGGIAHDFNNLLAAIAGNMGLAQLATDAGDMPRLSRYLQEAENAAIRARDLTQQLLTFARGGVPMRTTLFLDPVIREAVSFALTGSNSRSRVHTAPDLWPVHADVGQITQVLHNLLLNATQAMPEGGEVTVTAENVRVQAGDALSLPDGPYVRLAVHDQGAGIPVAIRDRIFDPFFTTRPHGSGLGLSSVYSILKAHDGNITVASSHNGSTFTCYLPALPAQHASAVAPTDTSPPPRALHLLIMDDEEGIRTVLREILREYGHAVTAVADGHSAIAAYEEARQRQTPFDLLILDLTVPGGMGGKEVLQQLLAGDPGVRAVASSGYATDPIMANYAAYGFVDCLAKPYRVQELEQLLARVFDGE